MTPHQFLRDLEAAKEACQRYAEDFDRLAEVAQVEKHAGHPLTARKFAKRANIAKRAYIAEVNDPIPDGLRP